MSQTPKKEDKNKPLLVNADLARITFKHNQRKYFDCIQENHITVCMGPPGTAKTFIACYTALDLLRKGEIKKIILCKSVVDSGESVGFLPGDLKEKIAPHMESYVSNLLKIITREKYNELVAKEVIVLRPISHMLGATFDDSIMILDEAQNFTMKQLMLFITRMGNNSKVVISGDVNQFYQKGSKKRDIAELETSILKDVKGAKVFTFDREDIVRHPILIEITDRYEKWKEGRNE
jgi:phosphate starvation-inducible PhoH-like protein